MDDTPESKNLWILTEERPKLEVVVRIVEKFAIDNAMSGFVDNLHIIPILNNDHFSFVYEVIGFHYRKIKRILISTVSGYSSFVDFLVFYQNEKPNPDIDVPSYAIEETKTDDSESRNTGVYQRCAKFVYIDNFYKSIKKVMLYNLQVEQKDAPTETNIFGTRLLLTNGVEIIGKKLDHEIFRPFTSIDELVEFKNSMRRPPSGNTPIEIIKYKDVITISGRLYKSGSLSHDPNIGALSIIASTLRKLGWNKRIVVVRHGLAQSNLSSTNKFILIANSLGVELDGLEVPEARLQPCYWRYDLDGEKIGTIFVHLTVENFTNSYAVYENHAGCERGYFLTSTGEHVAVKKYVDREKYKMGDKSKIVHLPDLVLLDGDRKQIVDIEGEMYKNKINGINQLFLFDSFENIYVKSSYPSFSIIRTVVLYGGCNPNEQFEPEVGFLLTRNGNMVLNSNSPEVFREAILRLLNFWR